MSVNKNIGYFSGIVSGADMALRQHDHNIQPISPITDKLIDHTSLKGNAGLGDTYGATDVMHWFTTKWGDVDKRVGV